MNRAIAVRAIGAAATLLLTWLIGRQLEGTQLAAVLTGWALTQQVGNVARLGLGNWLLRTVVQAAAVGRSDRSAVWLAVKTVCLRGVFVAALAALVVAATDFLFLGASAAMTLTLFCAAIVPQAIVGLFVEVHKGRSETAIALLLQTGGLAALVLAPVAMLGPSGSGTIVAAWFAVAYVALAAIPLLQLWVSRDDRAPLMVAIPSWRDGRRAVASFDAVQAALGWMPLTLVALLLTPEAAGEFGLAFRYAMVINVITVAAGSFLTPRVADVLDSFSAPEWRRLSTTLNVVLAIAGPACTVGVLAAWYVRDALGLAEAGVVSLGLLTLSQLAKASATGYVAVIVMSGDDQRLLRNSAAGAGVALALLAVGCLAGIVGASVGYGLGIVATAQMNRRSGKRILLDRATRLS